MRENEIHAKLEKAKVTFHGNLRKNLDGEFIAYAVQDMEYLSDQNQRLREEVQRLREALAREAVMCPQCNGTGRLPHRGTTTKPPEQCPRCLNVRQALQPTEGSESKMSTQHIFDMYNCEKCKRSFLADGDEYAEPKTCPWCNSEALYMTYSFFVEPTGLEENESAEGSE